MRTIPLSSVSGKPRLITVGAVVLALAMSALPFATASASIFASLTFTSSPGSTVSNTLSPSPVVQAIALGSPLSGLPVTLSIAPGTGTAGASLTCASNPATTDANGNATFSGCSISLAGTGYVLVASAAGGLGFFSPVSSTPFNIGTGTTDHLMFTNYPVGATPNVVFSPQPVVEVLNASNALDPTTSYQVTLGLSGTGSVICSGSTNTVTSIGGSATFSGCYITLAGTNDELTATASSPTALPTVFSAAFNVGTTDHLMFTNYPVGATPNVVFSPQPVVEVLNASNVPDTTTSYAVTLGLSGTGGVVCSGGNTVASSGGVADFSGCYITLAGTNDELTATASSPTALPTVFSAAFNVGSGTGCVSPGIPCLAFTSSPTSASTGVPFPTSPTVAIEDGSGNVLTSYSALITLSLASNPGGGMLTCAGGNSIYTSAGYATFTNCSISTAGVGYTLLASASSITPAIALGTATSAAFNVGGQVTATISLSATSSVITWTQPVTFDIQLGTNGAGQTFELEASPDGSTWAPITSLVADGSGTATFSYTPSRNEYYEASFPGSATLNAATSNVVRVVVRQIGLFRPASTGATRTIAQGTSVTFTTTVRPIGSGVPQETAHFVLYRWDGSSWVLQSSHLVAVDSSGRASWTWTANSAGDWYVRSQSIPTTSNANSVWSPVDRYNVS